jgi:hypothetical protein
MKYRNLNMQINSNSHKTELINPAKLLLCLCLMSFLSINSKAQLPDGTETTQEFINTLKLNLNSEGQEQLKTSSTETDIILNIDVYIVNNQLGLAVVNPSQISTLINKLNAEFWKIGLKFKIEKTVVIPEFEYGKYTDEQRINEITVKYSAKDRINLYLVDTIFKNNNFYYGFSYYPDKPDKNFIFMSKDCITGNYILTLMGHYFGLLSTHETMSGLELVSETNCKSAGDLICDTYADPGLFGNVTDSCFYILSKRDNHGDYYVPTVANYMSESLDKCKCKFTTDQYKRMSFYLRNYRNYLR